MSEQNQKPGIAGWLSRDVSFESPHKGAGFISEIADQVMNSFPRARLDELRFREVFLPYFAGDDPATLKYRVDVGNWITVAGGPFAEVDIYDKQGKVLFVVPPMFDRMAVRPEQVVGEASIVDMIRTMQGLGNVHPNQAKHYYETQFSKRARDLFNSSNVMKFINDWNKIFEFYGRPKVIIPGVNDQNQSTTGVNQTSNQEQNDGNNFELLP